MKQPQIGGNEAEVLEAFAMEPLHDRETLERYLRSYPEHTSALCELSFELNRTDLEERDLDDSDELLVAKAWSTRVASYGQVANPLGSLTGAEKQRLSQDLGVKMQVLTLFREGRIAMSTVPRKFMARFAELLEFDVEALGRALSVPALAPARSYKSDRRPEAATQVSFERALKESGASDGDVAALMGDP